MDARSRLLASVLVSFSGLPALASKVTAGAPMHNRNGRTQARPNGGPIVLIVPVLEIVRVAIRKDRPVAESQK